VLANENNNHEQDCCEGTATVDAFNTAILVGFVAIIHDKVPILSSGECKQQEECIEEIIEVL
jgi:hypothetical protein